MKKLIRHTAICFSFLAIAMLAFASKGGGGDKKKTAAAFKNNFTPISSSVGFSLKSGYTYNGSYVLSQEKSNNALSVHAMITYQKGNTTYILPYNSRINVTNFSNLSGRTNLQMLGVRIKMTK